MRRLGHQGCRVSEEARRIFDCRPWPGTTMKVLLRFRPTILAAVAVFLINMLILHEHLGNIDYGEWDFSWIFFVNGASATDLSLYFVVVQSVPGITATCNTKHLRSGKYRTMQSRLIPQEPLLQDALYVS